jgi:hypothetical protein
VTDTKFILVLLGLQLVIKGDVVVTCVSWVWEECCNALFSMQQHVVLLKEVPGFRLENASQVLFKKRH